MSWVGMRESCGCA